MYDFLGVKLGFNKSTEEYIITKYGNYVDLGLAEHQRRNVIICKNKFVNECSYELHRRVKDYCHKSGINPIYGCKVTGIGCQECMAVRQNTADNNCMFEGVYSNVK